MQIGIIGLPLAGKTTIFNALGGNGRFVNHSGGRFEVHTAVVDVPDARVDSLSALYQPNKTAYAKVTYCDIAGLEGSERKVSYSGPLLNQLSSMDGFMHVVRCFENASVPYPSGALDPMRDLEALNAEMLVNDLILVERRLERLAQEINSGGGRDKALVMREQALFERLDAALGDEIPLRTLKFSRDEEKTISGFGFLTQKPMLILFNTSDGQSAPCGDYPGGRCEVVALQGKLEMDIAQLEADDKALFMVEYGFEESGLKRVINESYCLMELQSFFTVGEDEVRAWTVPVGATALEAAGVIHSDLQKGFIRAEVVGYEDLSELGGLSEARLKGKLRLEGKDYIVLDGEIVHVRFNI